MPAPATVSEIIDAQVTKALSLAWMNEIYYRTIAERLARRDQAVRVLTAILSTAAVATWASGLDEATGFRLAWQMLSIAAAAMAILSQVLQWASRSRQYYALSTSWTETAGELRLLDQEADLHDIEEARLRKLQRRIEELQGQDPEPSRKDLAGRAYQQMRKELADRFLAQES